ncbi:MAG: hypothetical protein WA435_08065 [Gallionellaceae bacterium]
MGVNLDRVMIKEVIKVLREIEAKMGENELLNAIAREARLLIKRGELLLAKSNPHVADREELGNWAQDCAELSDYINVVAAQR